LYDVCVYVPSWRFATLLLSVVASISAGATPASPSRTWFVDSAATVSGDGSAAAPLQSLGAAGLVSAPGDVIVLVGSGEPYRDGIVLKDGQTLIGAGEESAELLHELGIAATAKNKTPVIASDGPAVTFASGNTIAGLKIVAARGDGITGSPSGKTTIRQTWIQAAGASTALALSAAAGSVRLAGCRIEASGGATAVRLASGNAEVVFDATPTSTAAGAALVMKDQRGSVVFSKGSPVTVASGATDAIVISGGGATCTFADILTVTTNRARAVVIRDAGTIAVTGTGSSLRTTAAAAVDISKARLDITLESVSVAGERSASSAIMLRDTTGRFAIIGRGSEPLSGGVIRETANRAVELVSAEGISLSNILFEHNALRNGVSSSTCASDLIAGNTVSCNAVLVLRGTRGVRLSHVRIDGSNQIGFNGENVVDLVLDDVQILGAGDEAFESAIQLRNATGSIEITGCRIERAAARGLYLQNGGGIARVAIRTSVFTNTVDATGQQGMLIGAHGDATVGVDVRDCEFSSTLSSGIQAVAAGNAKLTIGIAGSTFDRNAGAINLVASDQATLDHTIDGNRTTRSNLGAITVAALAPGRPVLAGTITKNTIGTAGVAASGGRCGGCHGISVMAAGGSRVSSNIAGNTIQQLDGPGVRVTAGGMSDVSIAIRDNVLREPAGSDRGAIRLQSGTGKADTAKLCVSLGGTGASANKISGVWSPEGNILLHNRFAATKLAVDGPAGIAGNAAVARLIAQQNNGATASLKLMDGEPGNAIEVTRACPVPNPVVPQE
jgi:hypothetical protein